MALALLDPLRDILQASARDVASRAKAGLAKTALAVAAAGLVLSAGLVTLTKAIGYPAAAVVFAAALGLLALVVHLVDRIAADRQARRIADATTRARADVAVATSVVRSVLPLVPVVAFVAAFAFGRRR